MSSTENVTAHGGLDCDLLIRLTQKPAPFAPGAALFWDDPHISQQMLDAHLNPDTDVASRRPEAIDRTVDWLVSYLHLLPGDRVLDLGCGPGLYCERLARRRLAVTGIDYSRRSLDYARAQAAAQRLPISYIYGNYVEAPYPQGVDAVLLIYGDLCVLAPEQRSIVLRKARAALKPDGCFVFDVTTPRHHQRVGARNSWEALESGFWRPSPHLVLTQGFHYPEADIWLDQFVVVTADGTITVYRNWFQAYQLETIRSVVEAAGFGIQAVWSDLAGTPYDAETEWIGITVRKC